MNAEVKAKLDELEVAMQETFATLQDDARPKAMLAGVILAFGLLWKAIRVIADALPTEPPPQA